VRIALDHLGWLGPDVDGMTAVFGRLGFRVLGPAPLRHGVSTGPAAQWSAHVMFRDTYLELTSLSAAAVDHPLYRWRTDPPAVRLVLLGAVDAMAERARATTAGWCVSELQHAERRLEYGAQRVARFRWFGLGENSVPGTEFPAPGTLVAWVQHLDREFVFDPGVRSHPNTALAIEAVHRSGRPWPAALADEAAGSVELVQCDGGPCASGAIAGVDFLVRDLHACARAMRDGGISFTNVDGALEVPADIACGARLRFRVGAVALQ
jgi:hypothetical protein